MRIHWLLRSQLGFDPRIMVLSLWGLPRYVRDYFRFRSSYKGSLELLPCLHDWFEEGGATKNEYFWQDLLVARMIFAAKPEKHVDVGSRVDGFVAHVASFREIEVLDLRPIGAKVPGVIFRQANLMAPLKGMEGYCDSLSCLHALEHFGLGRYGDPIDTNGFECGFTQMARLLRKNGAFYLAVPIGRERVEFNAGRIVALEFIQRLSLQNDLKIESLTFVREEGISGPFSLNEVDNTYWCNKRRSLVVFLLRKI